jgi:hypothetical protein
MPQSTLGGEDRNMKGIINKFASTSIVFLVAWVVAYGTVHAQPVCCTAIIDRSQPASKGIVGRALFSLPCTPTHRFNVPQLNGYSSAETSIQYDTGVACCETNACDDSNQAVFVVPLSHRPPSWIDTTPGYVYTASDQTNPFATLRTTIPLQTIPIYILKSTYLC